MYTFALPLYIAQKQSSVNNAYLKKHVVGSPLIMWLDNYGCICTYYLLALLNLRKGIILQYQEITLRVLIARRKMNPTHSWGRLLLHTMLCGLIEKDCMQISYWELFFDISKWFRECLSDSNTTSYTVSSIVNNAYPMPFYGQKRGILW